MYQDETLKCRDCGNEFVFTAGEQEFYAQSGFENKPSRCKECQVPFKPTEGKAVYCSECFAARRAAQDAE